MPAVWLPRSPTQPGFPDQRTGTSRASVGLVARHTSTLWSPPAGPEMTPTGSSFLPGLPSLPLPPQSSRLPPLDESLKCCFHHSLSWTEPPSCQQRKIRCPALLYRAIMSYFPLVPSIIPYLPNSLLCPRASHLLGSALPPPFL